VSAVYRVVYPDALRAALAGVPNFVWVRPASDERKDGAEVRLLTDSRDTGSAIATLTIDEGFTTLQLAAATGGELERARALVEEVLGGAVRRERDGSA
jgi:hypothetical protein